MNVLAGLHPLAVGDKVIIRTAKTLWAIDFNTGKRVWQPIDADSDQDEVSQNQFNPFGGSRNNNMSPVALYGQRIWDDATYGTMSSDGKLVFVVEQLGLGVMSQFNNMVIFGGGGRGERTNRAVSNRLAAYDIGVGDPKGGGKLVWQLGGPDDLRQTDTFFLGSPLPLRGQLYVIAEIKDEIRLLALDAATGNLLWSQQLAMVESSISQDPVRRLAGVSPSYADGVLICPTGSGCVVAVDLATRSLLWGYVYPATTIRRRRPLAKNEPHDDGLRQCPRTRAPLARRHGDYRGGRVLLTPAEADMLYCVNSGRRQTDLEASPRRTLLRRLRPSGQGRARRPQFGIDASISTMATRRGTTARSPTEPASSGHGFYSGNRYYVPLSSGEVVAVDLDEARSSPRPRAARASCPAIWFAIAAGSFPKGSTAWKSTIRLDAARTESAQLLAKNADDVEGLTLRGEIALDEGRSSEAVADFRRAYAIDDAIR